MTGRQVLLVDTWKRGEPVGSRFWLRLGATVKLEEEVKQESSMWSQKLAEPIFLCRRFDYPFDSTLCSGFSVFYQLSFGLVIR